MTKITCEVCGTTERCDSVSEMQNFLNAHEHHTKKRYDALIRLIDKHRLEIASLQNTCTHAYVKKNHRSSTEGPGGGVIHWTEFYCPECCKRWNKDGTV